MYHWDLPMYLANMGGLTNSSVVPAFTAYADVLFSTFGSQVCTVHSSEAHLRVVHAFLATTTRTCCR